MSRYSEVMTEHGMLPNVVMVAIFKLKPAEGCIDLVPVGQIEWFSVNCTDGGLYAIPGGWVPCNGKAFKRRDYPRAANCCRQFSSWWRWHVRKQFRVPVIPTTVMLDPSQEPYA